MRIVLFLMALSTTAAADTAQLAPLDVRTIPEACRAAATEPVSARVPGPRFAAYTSAANCMAMIKLREMKLSPNQQSATALEQALRPSVALLDAVIRSGDPKAQLIAEYAKADLNSGAAVALLSSIPATAYMTQVNDTWALTQPWRDRAQTDYQAVARIGVDNPDLALQDPVVEFAVREAAHATVIATR